jgi:cysteine desulfuration protein SufE
MGRSLEQLPEEFKIEDLQVKGCQSQVWLKAELTSDGRIKFLADSDALIVKGLIAILLRIYSSHTPAEILAISPDFIGELGFATNLSPSRANGLVAMIKQIKFYALAYSAKGRI